MKKDSTLTVATEGHPLVAEAVVVNSSGKDAMRIQGNVNISADSLCVVGGITIKGSLNSPEDMGISENMGDTGVVPDSFEEIPNPTMPVCRIGVRLTRKRATHRR